MNGTVYIPIIRSGQTKSLGVILLPKKSAFGRIRQRASIRLEKHSETEGRWVLERNKGTSILGLNAWLGGGGKTGE